MKTAISLPDDLYAMADEFARQRGLSRSELYATALRVYIRMHRTENLTERINRACANFDSALPQDLAHNSRRRLLSTEW